MVRNCRSSMQASVVQDYQVNNFDITDIFLILFLVVIVYFGLSFLLG